MDITTPPPPTVEDRTQGHEDDIAAIALVVADIETGFNANDPDLSVAHFIQNASAVTATGVQLTGREALLDANRRGLAGPLRDEHAHYELSDVVFLRPDVAIAHKHAWATDADGQLVDLGHAMVALYVLVKEGGRWWVAARQNTLVPPPDPAA